MTRILSGAFCALIILSALFLPGCSSLDVTHKLAPDFESAAPVKVAVLGAAWQDKEDETANDGARVGGLISDLAQDKAMSLGYSTVRAEGKAHDAKRALDAEQYAQTARSLSVDAVLVPIIAGWERSAHIAGYVSFAFEASFTLISADGRVLWSASFKAEESDMPVPMSVRSDSEALEISIHKAYEARLQRYVDAAFATLPPMSAHARPRTHYDWLP